MILADKLIADIEKAKNDIDKEKLDQLTHLLFKRLEEDAIFNSALQDADNRDRKSEVIERFKDAWDYGTSSYYGHADINFIRGIAARVEPCLFNARQSSADSSRDFAPLRDHGGTALPGINYLPPSDRLRIETDLHGVLNTVRETQMHPVEEALFLYYHIARIQPFEHGNKRTANITMNSILRGNDFAPISIPCHEIPIYEEYLAEAISDFREIGATVSEPSERYLVVGPNQDQLYRFLAKKELNALLQAHDDLKGLPKYHITINANQPGVLYSVKHKVGDWFRSRKAPFQEHLDVPHHSIELVGDISQRSLQKILSQMKAVKSYDIQDNGKR